MISNVSWLGVAGIVGVVLPLIGALGMVFGVIPRSKLFIYGLAFDFIIGVCGLVFLR